MKPILKLEGVGKQFSEFALEDVSFSLEPGFIMGFIGANGAGKSTTIKLIMNLLHLDEGKIKVFDLDSRKHEFEIKQRIGFVYDENHFYEDLTIREMTTVVAPFYKNWNQDLYQDLVQKFELPQKKKIKTFSRGMKMKYSLAIALAHDAELLIMDEPTSGLDPMVRSEFLDILSEIIQDERKSVLFSSHITSDLDRIADYITLIHDGRILFSESKDQLLEDYSLIKGGHELLDGRLEPYLVGMRENQFGFEGLVTGKNRVQALVQEQAILERPRLEDIMIFSTRGNSR